MAPSKSESNTSANRKKSLPPPPFASMAPSKRRVHPFHLVLLFAPVILLAHSYFLHVDVVGLFNRPSVLPRPLARTLRRASFIPRGERGARRVLIITASTGHYARHIRNLACSVRASTGWHPVLFALDSVAAICGRKMNIPTVDMLMDLKTPLHDRPFQFKTKEFNAVSLLKLRAVRDALLSGSDVIFSDVDVVWCADAAAALLRRARERPWADVLIQNGLTKELQWPIEPNTGFFFARATPGVVQMFDGLVNRSADAAAKGMCDQFLFRQYACDPNQGEGVAVNGTSTNGVHSCVWRDRVTVEMLPLMTYPNGHWPLGIPFNSLERGQLTRACVKKEVVVFHNNFCDAKRKRERMDLQQLWSVNENGSKCVPMGTMPSMAAMKR